MRESFSVLSDLFLFFHFAKGHTGAPLSCNLTCSLGACDAQRGARRNWSIGAAIAAGQIADYCVQRGMTAVAKCLIAEATRMELSVTRETRPNYLARTYVNKLAALEQLVKMHGPYNGIASVRELIRFL